MCDRISTTYRLESQVSGIPYFRLPDCIKKAVFDCIGWPIGYYAAIARADSVDSPDSLSFDYLLTQPHYRMLGSSSPPTKTVMSFYQVHRPCFRTKTLTKMLLAGIALSAPLFAVGCSHLGHTSATHADHQSTNASAATGGQSAEAKAATADHTDGAGHGHKPGIHTNHDIYHSKGLEVPAGTAVPAITVRVDTDPVRGWNLYVGTANFDFTPSKINGESGPSEGHAHLYINDKPIQRIYGNWTHLPDLPAGKNEVRVTLNANGHETLTTQGTPIEDSVTVDVYKPAQAQSAN